jgi:hypothetical protein
LPDYYVSAVRRDENGTTLQLKVHQTNPWDGTGATWQRIEVVGAIENLGKSFMTMYYRDGKWVTGEDIRVIRVNNVPYLRTDANKTARDNLDNLPTF